MSPKCYEVRGIIPFTEPTVTESIGKLVFLWPLMELKVVTDRITDTGTAELWFYHHNDTGDSLLHTTKANLLSTSTMGQISKRMSQHSDDIPWQQVLTYISAHTMESQRRGEQGVIIEPDLAHITHPGYFIEPIILKGLPSVIYGDKGVNKTSMALSLLGIVANEDTDSPTELVAIKKTNVGMLDWQSNKEIIDYTLGRLIKGQTIKPFKLPYLRCKQRLTDDIDHIANFITEYQLNLVLIDSLGQAAGSDKFDSAGKGAALQFFECLRQLNITSLIIAENAKNEGEGKKTIFGSAYYTYYARNVFELKGKVDEINEDRSHLALFHQEANYSKKYPPMGFCIDYTDTTISISREAVSVSQFLEKASQTKAMLEFLKDGAKAVKTISSELDLPDNRVRVMLTRAKRRKLVVDLGSGMWGLLGEE